MPGAEHVRVLHPAPNVLAFYEGRDGRRYAERENWVDEGALSLGIASYAIVDGDEALVYDTHVSVERGRLIRSTLEREGVGTITVVLSHHHLDHVAGTEAFAGCEVIATVRAAEHLRRDRDAIERGQLEGPPAIDPLVLPTRTFEGRLELGVGSLEAELIAVDIHSDDAAVLWLPGRKLLFAGDTLEDTVTYVGEPESFDNHLADLGRLRELGAERILPDHGDPGVIAAGGYGPGLIDATSDYIRVLQRCRTEPDLREAPLRELLAEGLADGSITWFEPYEAVHRLNVAAVLASGGEPAG